MNEEAFAALTLTSKWIHLKATMDYILSIDKRSEGDANTFSLRRRYNPHHQRERLLEETKLFKEQQRNLRLEQYQLWGHVKNLYAAHRDELVNTLEDPEYEEYKAILERIFTMEVDDALRDILDENPDTRDI